MTECDDRGTGQVELSRVDGFRDRLRKYRVILDGSEVGRIKNGSSIVLDVPAGSHLVSLKIDWKASPAVRLDVREGSRVSLACGPTGGAFDGMEQVLLNMSKENYLFLQIREA